MLKKEKIQKKKQGGITLIALVITIIVLLILAGVTISTLFGQNGIIENAIKAKEETEEAEKQEQEQIKELESLIENKGEDVTGFDEEKEVNTPEISNENKETGLIPIKWNGENWEVCSQDDPTWYNYSNQKITVTNKEGNEEEIEAFTWANAMLSDGKYKVGEVEEGTEITDINDLGSMFVWIPRYAYSINEYKVKQDPVAQDGITQNITKVEFLKGASNIGTTGNTYSKDYNAESVAQGESTPMIVHPAFTFGGEELKGIWVAKFEASMEEENLNTIANNDVTNKTIKVVPNKVTWRYIREGNIFKNCLNMKENEKYKLPENADTHQMKNSEWGAVSYLSASQYGKIPAKNDLAESYTENGQTKYREYAGEKDYIANVNQSTTGNATGIYDMNGGAWEYVAAYWDNGTSYLGTNGTEDIFQKNADNYYELKKEYIKYFDKYEVGELEKTQGATIWNMKNTEGNKKSYEIAKDRVNLMKNIKGDAMFEAINESSYYGRYGKATTQNGKEYAKFNYQTWLKPTIDSEGNLIDTGEGILWQYGRGLYGDDYTLVGTYNLPFVLRGGIWGSGAATGVFASYSLYGSPYYYRRFSSGGCGVALFDLSLAFESLFIQQKL